MVVDIWSAGDPSIGNSGGFAKVFLPGFSEWAATPAERIEQRESVREALVAAFQEIFDDGCVVALFQDEYMGAAAGDNIVPFSRPR